MPYLEQKEGKVRLSCVQGRLTFEHVQFRYSDNDHHSLANVSLDVLPGETIAMVGHSGAGKFTMLNLSIGFIQPTGGGICLDARDISIIDLRAYRGNVSVVSQGTICFDGTTHANILYNTRKVSEA